MVIRAGCKERNRENDFNSRDRAHRVISAKSACFDASNAAAHQHNHSDGSIGRHGPFLASSRGVRDSRVPRRRRKSEINEWHELAANRRAPVLSRIVRWKSIVARHVRRVRGPSGRASLWAISSSVFISLSRRLQRYVTWVARGGHCRALNSWAFLNRRAARGASRNGGCSCPRHSAFPFLRS